eukprot:4908090-Pyramimonas_sp.AAC.1
MGQLPEEPALSATTPTRFDLDPGHQISATSRASLMRFSGTPPGANGEDFMSNAEVERQQVHEALELAGPGRHQTAWLGQS